ncbi:MAG: hypothetical protein Q8P59_02145, partial [Dehalococcoidia bacterium]|nr:hypothetical protein [Dehalococcoidia bacterium]
PTNPKDLGDFMVALVNRMGNRVAGYIILNEPNLASEWGGRTPDAVAYMSLLREAYTNARAVNPSVTIVSAPLAPTNDSGPLAVDDRGFLQKMYDNGLKDYSTVVGVNALGFAYSPDDTSYTTNGLNLSRVKQLHDIMVANGDAGKQVWALEVGWLQATSQDLGQYNWMEVSETQRAQYLTRAYQKAYNEWPWMGLMFIWNLDFGIGQIPPSPGEAEPEKGFFGLLAGSDYAHAFELPSYAAVSKMDKPPATYTPTPTPTPTPTQTPTPTPTSPPRPTPTPTPNKVFIPALMRNMSGW